MAKVKCIVCSSKPGKRICIVRENKLICPVCCATNRDENCAECKYYKISESFESRKKEKGIKGAGSYFGSPAMQKSIMEASMDMMNTHKATGDEFDNDTEKFIKESFEFFNSDEYKDYSFTDEEIDLIISELGKPSDENGWFHTQEGTEYYTKAVNMILNDERFRYFSKDLMAVFLKYYRKKEFRNAWLILSTSNRIMEGEFCVPFTILMFFRGISRWKLERQDG